MKIITPFIQQELGTNHCGQHSLAMVLPAYDYRYYYKTVEQICRELGTDGWTFMGQLGSYLQNQGLKTEIVTSNPDIVRTGLDIDSQEAILEEIVQRKEKARKGVKRRVEQKPYHVYDYMETTGAKEKEPEKPDESNRVKCYEHLQDYMQDGGEIRIDIPDSDVIEETLESGNLCIVNLTNQWRESPNNKGGFNSHYVVPTGLTDEGIVINDSIYGNPNEEKVYSRKEMDYCIAANTRYGPDCGSILRILGKKR